MKRLYALILFLLILAISSLLTDISLAEHATTSAGDNAGGITGSRHNLSSTGSPFAAEITEICVFCHTPHHASQTMGPLWNRGNDGSYTAYTGESLGADHTGGIPGYGTLACLSCHDGVTTFDNLVNAPGKDLNSGDQGWTFHMPGIASIGLTSYDTFTDPSCDVCHDSAGILYGAVGYDVEIARLVIGEDLTDDHPVSMAYEGGNHASERDTNTTLGLIDLRVVQANGTTVDTWVVSDGGASTGYAGNGNLWSVNGMITSSATITDILRGNDSFTDEREYVQCTSCHDPHYSNRTNSEASFYTTYSVPGTGGTSVATHDDLHIDGLFLRRVGGNSDSGVCRTCHNK